MSKTHYGNKNHCKSCGFYHGYGVEDILCWRCEDRKATAKEDEE